MTHGPAISTSGPGGRPTRPNALYSNATRVNRLRPRLRFGQGPQPSPPVLVGSADERLEQGVRFHRLGLELGMKLAAEIPRAIGDLADLDVGLVGRLARDSQPRGFQPVLVFPVELVAVTVALVDF